MKALLPITGHASPSAGNDPWGRGEAVTSDWRESALETGENEREKRVGIVIVVH